MIRQGSVPLVLHIDWISPADTNSLKRMVNINHTDLFQQIAYYIGHS